MSTMPPSALRVACVDMDGTIFPWREPMNDPSREPFPGVADAMQALKDAGYRVVIFTSRLSPTWAEDHLSSMGVTHKAAVAQFTKSQHAYVRLVLNLHHIPFDDVTCEKLPASVYFDDKAVHVGTGYLAACIGQWLEEQA